MPARDELAIALAWQQHVGDDVGPSSVLERAINRYREPWRVYHGVGHLIRVVQAIDEVVRDAPATAIHDRGTVVAAAVFHDAVYEPGRVDNEAASAALALRELTTLPGWTPERAARVAAMIEHTAGHRQCDDGPDTDVLIAADLAILAASPARYAEYCTGIRREYPDADDDAWAAGRSTVLRNFLDREAIFPVRLGLTSWEHRARANMTAEIASLAATGSATS